MTSFVIWPHGRCFGFLPITHESEFLRDGDVRFLELYSGKILSQPFYSQFSIIANPKFLVKSKNSPNIPNVIKIGSLA